MFDKKPICDKLSVVVDLWIDSLTKDELDHLTKEKFCYIIDFTELAKLKVKHERKND